MDLMQRCFLVPMGSGTVDDCNGIGMIRCRDLDVRIFFSEKINGNSEVQTGMYSQ